ncbi:FxsA family protein [Cystobacter fuscus]|uniref:FxsA family protein n=1 Tax=Cystobacter fuscus TaxID=43 RepID=UPI002B280BA2|nr:FxsA family protein [Cystobacter fuscus]
MSRFLLPLVLLPFVELYLLSLIAREVGVVPMLALVLLSGVIGASLARREGLRVLRRWQESVARRQVPEEGLLGGVLVLAGGLLLVIPGVVSDVLGLLLLLPPTRRVVARWVRRGVERRMASGSIRVTTFSTGPFPEGPFGPPPVDSPFPPQAPRQPRIERGAGPEVDAEFTEEKGRE